MTVTKKAEYTCDICGKTASALYEGYMPPGWVSLGDREGSYWSAIVGTWLYVPLTYHFCSTECQTTWLEEHPPVESQDGHE